MGVITLCGVILLFHCELLYAGTWGEPQRKTAANIDCYYSKASFNRVDAAVAA